MAASLGISPVVAWVISATNLTSAGQVAGVGIIAAAGSYLEMAVSQLVINIRYSLMALSLSQKLDSSFTTAQRLLLAHGITDEIFAVAYDEACRENGRVTPAYMYGLLCMGFFSWTTGSILGAAAGTVLPATLTDAMGIMLYAMFLAVVLPAARKSKGVLMASILAAAISILFYYVITAVSSGFAIIISAICAAAVCAALFPIPQEEDPA